MILSGEEHLAACPLGSRVDLVNWKEKGAKSGARHRFE